MSQNNRLPLRSAPWLLPMVLAVGACVAVPVPMPPVPMPPEQIEDACGASALQGLVGQPESVVAGLNLAGPVRILRPGMAVTMEYSAERLNIEVDEAGIILRVACG